MRPSRSRRIAALLLAFAAGVLAAPQGRAQGHVPGPELELPLDCVPGKDCWISNHVDLDPENSALDYACGRLSYNGHNGTDFALRDLQAMREGVSVLAAAPGTVRAVRDGEPDVSVRERADGTMRGRECGNGVRIDHGAGWQTQYCHLRRGSVAVRQGQDVRRGERIGLVGLSGETEYPHLHFIARYAQRIVDPFVGLAQGKRCGPGESPLWSASALRALPYTPTVIYNFGIAPRTPAPEEIRRGAFRGRTIAPDAGVLAIWAEAFGIRAADRMELRLEGPGGNALIEQRSAVPADQARVLRIAGRKRGVRLWETGTYRGRVTVRRPGEAEAQVFVIEFTAEVR